MYKVLLLEEDEIKAIIRPYSNTQCALFQGHLFFFKLQAAQTDLTEFVVGKL